MTWPTTDSFAFCITAQIETLANELELYFLKDVLVAVEFLRLSLAVKKRESLSCS